MCAWRADPVGGRTRLVKDVAREHCASDREITRVCLRVSAGLRPNACDYQDPDAYAAAWRDALVKALRTYKAAADRCFSAVLDRRFDEARLLRLNGGVAAKTRHRARAHRAWRRNAERMALEWGAVALRRPHGAPLFLVIIFGLSPPRGVPRARTGRF
jgi:hypothetical protein